MNRTIIDFLSRVFHEKGIQKNKYSFDEYKEEAVCLEEIDGKYCVYDGERGNRYGEAWFNDLYEAYCCMVSRLKLDDYEENSMESGWLCVINISDEDYKTCVRYGFDFVKNFEEMIKKTAKELRKGERNDYL